MFLILINIRIMGKRAASYIKGNIKQKMIKLKNKNLKVKIK